ncbi:MAG: hypothetical protein K8L99_02240 [Anaerolineae bacterium]|nr:hypothetical protein [Anaerolineae bacterium]
MNENTNRLQNIPGIRWALVHPRLAAWIVLSLGMVILLVIEARDVGLLATQWAALVVACVLVAGACVWIISWEDADEEVEPSSTETADSTDSSENQI